jgi:hypothetical protein
MLVALPESLSCCGPVLLGKFLLRIMAQPIEVVGILVAAGDRRHPCHQHFEHRMSDATLIAPIRHGVRKPPAYTDQALRLSQQQEAAIGGLVAAVKINCEFLSVRPKSS